MSVVTAEPGHIPEMVDILEMSFEDIPGVTEWIVKKDHRYNQRLRLWFEMLLNQSIPFNHVYYDPENSSVAIWYPPNSWKIGLIKQLLLAPRLMQIIGINNFRSKSLHLLDMSKRHPIEPHYYLSLLGTAPSKQGKGIGSFLVNLILNHCKDMKIPAYVESNETAYAFYKRHGFQTLDEFLLPDSNIRIRSMWLNPYIPS